MAKPRPHTHTCQTCHHLYPCHGELEQNVDGWPEVICDVYHLCEHVPGARQCQECYEKDADERREATTA